ncbi:MAG: alpha-amylase family glycosyl hydrolase, partial [Candidatus Competibacteraceae bacterium]|nr:alpha-amylase family glycosyl hydrolase [Candidatus Competibacteraceae bacterium]
AAQQPELNYRNPQVLEAMQDVMRFWFDKGVDGFRVDVIEFLLKDEQLRDEPEDANWNGVEPYARLRHIHTRNLPGVHDLIRRFRATVDEYHQRVLIGEVFVFDEAIRHYYGKDGDGCHLPFNFRLMYRTWDAPTLRREVELHESLLDPEHWPNWVLGNHDQHRIATRVGYSQARVANMLLLTLRGTPTSYYGEEIGLEDVPIPTEKVQDPQALNQLEVAHIFGRDPERTPMQWDDSPNAGFCDAEVEPWLPVAEDYATRNVAVQEADPRSMLALYRALTRLRRAEPALHSGDYATVGTGEAADQVLAFRRDHQGSDSFLVVLNIGRRSHTLDLSAAGGQAQVAVSTALDRSGPVELGALELGPDEGLVLRLR